MKLLETLEKYGLPPVEELLEKTFVFESSDGTVSFAGKILGVELFLYTIILTISTRLFAEKMSNNISVVDRLTDGKYPAIVCLKNSSTGKNGFLKIL